MWKTRPHFPLEVPAEHCAACLSVQGRGTQMSHPADGFSTTSEPDPECIWFLRTQVWWVEYWSCFHWPHTNTGPGWFLAKKVAFHPMSFLFIKNDIDLKKLYDLFFFPNYLQPKQQHQFCLHASFGQRKYILYEIMNYGSEDMPLKCINDLQRCGISGAKLPTTGTSL